MNNIFRPDWDLYFMALAFVISTRSRDPDTKHGSVIVDSNNIILGTGYNSWIKEIDDSLIPITRPDKYLYVIHSELNSILNCRLPPRAVDNARIYVTGQVCNDCFQKLYQSGVKHIIMARRKGTQLETEETKEQFDFLVKQTKVRIEYMDISKINQIFINCIDMTSVCSHLPPILTKKL